MARRTAIVRPENDVTETIEISAGKWTILVVRRLGGGRQRFNELRRQLSGISQKTLTTTLRGLERDGFVERTFFPTIPPRVEYELTAPGLELLEMTNAWGEFIRRHHDTIAMARRRFEDVNGRGV